MTLADWLTAANETYSGFARRIGAASAKTVERYAKGERIPSRAAMAAIYEATEGAVAPNDFYGLAEGEGAADSPEAPAQTQAAAEAV